MTSPRKMPRDVRTRSLLRSRAVASLCRIVANELGVSPLSQQATEDSVVKGTEGLGHRIDKGATRGMDHQTVVDLQDGVVQSQGPQDANQRSAG